MAIFTGSLIPSRSMRPHHPIYATERKLGVQFRDPNLLKTALTHSSYLNEHLEENLECNERLEFLGDAALDLAVADALYKKDAEIQEGALTLMRSLVVDGKTLARVARELDIGEHLLMGSGEEKTGGRNRDSNLAAAVEAIVGAIYLDNGEMGHSAARAFCIKTLNDEINSAYHEVTSSADQAKSSGNLGMAVTAGKHPKSALQELAQARHGVTPDYCCDEPEGESHKPTFTATVSLEGEVKGRGKGASKKAAETAAAQQALKALSKYS